MPPDPILLHVTNGLDGGVQHEELLRHLGQGLAHGLLGAEVGLCGGRDVLGAPSISSPLLEVIFKLYPTSFNFDRRLKQFISLSVLITYSEQPQTLTMEDMQLHDGLEVGESGRRPLSCLFIVEVITSS